MDRHTETIAEVSRLSVSYWSEQLDSLTDLLASTTAGRQGVLPAKMMLNLWRYIRKAVARDLYATGVFRDDVPRSGLLTVFYENCTRSLDGLFD